MSAWSVITLVSECCVQNVLPYVANRTVPFIVLFTSVGEEVGYYFAWMNFYSMFLLLPAMVGCIMYLLRPSSSSVDNDPYLPFYSVFISIWGVLFIRVNSQQYMYVYNYNIIITIVLTVSKRDQLQVWWLSEKPVKGNQLR